MLKTGSIRITRSCCGISYLSVIRCLARLRDFNSDFITSTNIYFLLKKHLKINESIEQIILII